MLDPVGRSVRADGFDPRDDRALAVDISEADQASLVTIDLPGVETAEIDLRYDEGEGALVVDAESAAETVSEHGTGRRHRRVRERIPVDDAGTVAVEEIAASYRNGVLTVRMPRVEPGTRGGNDIPVSDAADERR